MFEKLFNSPENTILTKAMDAASLRNEVIANNVANVDTPGFKKSEVIFEEKLKKVLDDMTIYDKLNTTNSRHIQINSANKNRSLLDVNPEISKVSNTTYRNDGNNVDIDVEMAENTKNKIYYDAVSQSMNNKLRLLRIAITGRR